MKTKFYTYDSPDFDRCIIAIVDDKVFCIYKSECPGWWYCDIKLDDEQIDHFETLVRKKLFEYLHKQEWYTDQLKFAQLK